MSYIVTFLLAFFLGGFSAYYAYKPTHDLVISLETKYTRLLNLLAEWQKKV